MPPFNRTISAPARFQAQLDTLEVARSNGDTVILSSYTSADGRQVIILETQAGVDEATSLANAATGLQAKSVALGAVQLAPASPAIAK